MKTQSTAGHYSAPTLPSFTFDVGKPSFSWLWRRYYIIYIYIYKLDLKLYKTTTFVVLVRGRDSHTADGYHTNRKRPCRCCADIGLLPEFDSPRVNAHDVILCRQLRKQTDIRRRK